MLQHRDKGASPRAPHGARSTAPLLCPSTAPWDRLAHTAVLTNNSPSCKLPGQPGKQHLGARWNGGGEVFYPVKETGMVCAVSRAVQQDGLRNKPALPSAAWAGNKKALFGAVTALK